MIKRAYVVSLAVLLTAKATAGTIIVTSLADVSDISDFTITASIDFMPFSFASNDNRFFIFLDNGATFQSEITISDLVVTTGSATFDLVTGSAIGASELEFRYTSPGSNTDVYTLTLNNIRITGGSSPVSIDAHTDDSFGTFDFFTSATLAQQASPVPEPAHYAAAFGLISLVGVILARRRRRAPFSEAVCA